jgi:tRNA (guanosine-2'-O-)-methyltransferase
MSVNPLEQFLTEQRQSRIEEVLNNRTTDITIVLENVHNVHNISAVIRSADAFGVAEVFIMGNADNLEKGISLGTEQWINVHRCKDSADAIEQMRSRGYKLVVTSPGSKGKNSIPIESLPHGKQRLAFVLGNERIGASSEITAAADYLTYIPMYGFVESFNVSVACALILQTARQGFSRSGGPSPISPELRAELREKWITASVRRGEDVRRELEFRLLSNGSKS